MNRYFYIIISILPLNLMASESILSENKTHTDNVDSLCLIDKAIISASFDGSVRKTIDNNTKIIGKHRDWVRKVLCIDSDIVSASNDGVITVWNKFKKINSVQAHTWWITDIALSKDKIISVSLDESIKIWSYPELKLLFSRKIHGSNKHHSVIVNNNKIFIGATKGIMFVLDMKSFNVSPRKWVDWRGGSTLLSSAKSNKYVFFGTSNGHIARITVSPPYKVFKKKVSNFAIKSIAQHQGILYVGDDNGELKKLKIKNLKTYHTVSHYPEAIRTLAVDKNLIYVGYDKGYIRIFKNR